MATSPPLGSSPASTVSAFLWLCLPCGLSLVPPPKHPIIRRCFRKFNILATVMAPFHYVVSRLKARVAKTISRSHKLRSCCTSAALRPHRRPSQSSSHMTNPAAGFQALTITHLPHPASLIPSPSHAMEYSFMVAPPPASSTPCKPCDNLSRNPRAARNCRL